MQKEVCNFINCQIKEVHIMKKILSLLLALCLLFGAVPVALADTTCDHSSTGVYYTANDDGTHQLVVYCQSETCGKIVYEDVENCSDMDNDRECDKCNAAMLGDPLCDHNTTSGSFTANNDGTHTVKMVCEDCFATLLDYEEACKDTDADGLCDRCAAEVVKEDATAVISCEQNGTMVTANEATMVFTVSGVDAEDVTWTFEASGSAEPVLNNTTAEGKTGTVAVRATNGHGVAKVTATAHWAGGQKSGSAHISFCERRSYTVEIKKDTKAFTFTQTKMFESVDKIAAMQVDGYSLYRLLVDGCGTSVMLYEDSKLNERVADITYRTTGTKLQYDPDGYNTYALSGLGALTFTITGEGTYELKYEVQEKVGSTMYPTTRGTIKIVVGTPADKDVNMHYRTTVGVPVTFDMTDFVTFWEDNRLRKEELRFVRFEIDDRATGVLYLDETCRGTVEEEYSFYCNLRSEKNPTSDAYDLDHVTYKPDPREEAYTEDIVFVAYGRSNGVVRGTIRVTVGEKMEFTDVAKEDWFYEEVSDVFSRGIMTGISDTEFAPDATLTRGMVVTMLHRAAGEPAAESTGSFTDVAADAWYAKAVQWAAENSIVLGMGDGTFAPDADITREQLAAILFRYAGLALIDVNTGAATLDGYADERIVSDYAVEPMTWAVYQQIINGIENYLYPTANATRAQAAVAFSRLLK